MTSWLFRPRVLMVWFCAVHMLSYLERGAVASNGVTGQYVNETCSAACPDDESIECRNLCGFTGIQGEFRLTNAEAGLVASLYTVGLTIACPISAHAVRFYHPFTIIGVGELVYVAALVGCGFSSSYEMLLCWRTLLGVAEPTFIVVAPPLIDRMAPPQSRTVWLAFFYVCISLGSAVGFIYGGLFVNTDWRWSFRLQAAMSAPFALLFLVSRPEAYAWGNEDPDQDLEGLDGSMTTIGQNPPHTASPLKAPTEATRLCEKEERGTMRNSLSLVARVPLVSGQKRSVCTDVRDLLSIVQYNLVLAAYVCMTAVSGVIIFWGPKAGKSVFNLDNADLYMGIMVVVSGVAGTLCGGWLLDKLGGGYRNATRVCCIGMLLGATLCTAAFWVPPENPNVVAFFTLFSLGYFCIATLYGPIAAATLWAAPPDLRAQAMGFSTLAIHVLGDVPSPFYAGALQDKLNNWQLTLTLITPLLGASAFFFFLATLSSREEKTDSTNPATT
ncbi:putative sphingolipid transporter spinster-like protein 1 [Diplonema papillatum]|nr:putative sphingolipid transporter spinster-like protein 1 [Diplonema papillatum]|eukprot:gene4084-6344_t